MLGSAVALFKCQAYSAGEQCKGRCLFGNWCKGLEKTAVEMFAIGDSGFKDTSWLALSLLQRALILLGSCSVTSVRAVDVLWQLVD